MARRALLFNALVILLVSHVATAATLDEIRDRGMLIVSVKNQGIQDAEKHRDPAHFQKRDFELRLARAIAARVLGSPGKLELRMMRKPERLGAVARGDVDLGISMMRVTPESLQKVDFSTPYYHSGLAVMQPKGGPVHALKDLGGRSFAAINRNDVNVDLLLSYLPASNTPPKVTVVDNYREAVAAIQAGKVEGLISEAVNIDVFLSRHGGGFERSPLLAEDVFAVAMAKGSDELRQVVNEVIAELQKSGEFDQMAQAASLPTGDPRP